MASALRESVELETLVCSEVQVFPDHLITVRKLAWATINVYFSAYRFLYGSTFSPGTSTGAG